MQQYLQLLQEVKEKGTLKPAARENMPSTISLFGYQFRHNLYEGFPLLTTKEINFSHITTELLWFLKGNTNIKYLIDNNCNIWNEDAYNYYLKILDIWSQILTPYNLMICEENGMFREFTFEEFVEEIRNSSSENLRSHQGYLLGDCGEQYGRLWRSWNNSCEEVDQLMNLIIGLKQNPTSRRHIITAWNPSSLDKMALPACHSFVQFNCRLMSEKDKIQWVMNNTDVELENLAIIERIHEPDVPKYKLDCQLYQRSADVFLGVPYNIASYSLLIHIISKMCNFAVGEFIHSFGDVHLYDNHVNVVEIQLKRKPTHLPNLTISSRLNEYFEDVRKSEDKEKIEIAVNRLINELIPSDFIINDYQPQNKIKAKLSTGLKK